MLFLIVFLVIIVIFIIWLLIAGMVTLFRPIINYIKTILDGFGF